MSAFRRVLAEARKTPTGECAEVLDVERLTWEGDRQVAKLHWAIVYRSADYVLGLVLATFRDRDPAITECVRLTNDQIRKLIEERKAHERWVEQILDAS